ncbi:MULTISPECIES: DUF1345 domain-containing protein [Streptomyces]|uniref:DUF1345 domain-containing protein n=2 Tax=Streptomyces TaxID=1883 RepID=UPI00099808E1|nr:MULTISPECIES: DUF1345 domain-containing protein [Streptomyces]MBP2341397.1 putative membrane protein [Streptomyces virginiae]MCI4079123.1 DUF1345 domain-containing protein [Streptomyces sp. MMS21 TC-5]QNE29612.1 DUF1345 domain-containing protein [Streptomyces sp. INR7]GGQ07200.1 hypothetical protein GCM10010215_35630 [Streptomyces virginiae]GLV92762.1 hypothetical protein Slala04_42160 [Streptomyces lavendulae subsp. lavendulae]
MTGQNASDTDRMSPSDPAPGSAVRTESRWPMAAAVIASAVLTLLLPDDLRFGPRWALPFAEGLLLVALISGDPGRISRRSSVLRSVAIALVVVLVGSAIWSTVRLIDDLIHGGSETSSANALLLAGGSVWASTVLAFSLLYFELDSGGPAARAHHMPPTPALAFPQQLSPEVKAPHWRPRYIDYLYLGFTNSTALSPTDVMPLASWAKSVMALQSILSLMILGLVVARAVNVLA